MFTPHVSRFNCQRAAIILLLTVLAYLPVFSAGFIWDDDAYVTENPLLTAPDGLQRIWLSRHFQSQYFPLVYTTLRFEHALWGLNATGYHAVNLLFHCANALLLWALLRRLALPGAWLAAAIFALHPVQVETVAWITELKNTESTFFYLLTILAWLKFLDAGSPRRWWLYALALLFHALALFSKTTACTVPAALALAAWLRGQPLGWRRWVGIGPFAVLGLGMGLVAVWWEQGSGSTPAEFGLRFGITERWLVATRAVWFYAMKLLWPVNLAFSYPRWEISPASLASYFWAAALLGLAVLVWWRRKSLGREPVAAGIFFVAVLSPMLGFFWLYTFRYSFVADHYQYLASAGLMALFAGGVTKLAQKWALNPSTRYAFAAVLLVGLGGLTWRQARVYHDVETLWADTLKKNPASWLAHNNLGFALAERGRNEEAAEHFRNALRFKSDYAEALNNLGSLLGEQGQTDAAITHYEAALRAEPNHTGAHCNLGSALAALGRMDEAMAHYAAALRRSPDDSNTHNNLAAALMRMGKLDEAATHFERALRAKPDDANTLSNLGQVYAAQRQFDKAISYTEAALRAAPDSVAARYNLANIFAAMGRFDEAMTQYRETLRRKPDHADAHNNLAVVLALRGRPDEAAAQYRETLRLQPNHPLACNNLGRVLFEQGKFEEAVPHFEAALRIQPDYPEAHFNLGCALAKLDRRHEAVAHLTEALRLSPNHPAARSELEKLKDPRN